MYTTFHIKRCFDIIASLSILLLFAPVGLVVTVLLFFANKGKPFFVQTRPGKHGISFSILKFKTMNDMRGEEGELLPDAQRLTRIGSFVRKSSLDELPQLINVLKGEMSLIGPRPLLKEYLPLYSVEQARRHDVTPGITGWAQVNGRNNISWCEKFKLDIYYVDNISFSLDMKILWLTILNVIRRDGVNQDGEATVEYFNGKN